VPVAQKPQHDLGGRSQPALLDGEGRQSGVGQFRLARHAAKASDPGIADTFQFSTHLFAADRREADGYTLFCHGLESLKDAPARLTF
jgi:hypothetical protein